MINLLLGLVVSQFSLSTSEIQRGTLNLKLDLRVSQYYHQQPITVEPLIFKDRSNSTKFTQISFDISVDFQCSLFTSPKYEPLPNTIHFSQPLSPLSKIIWKETDGPANLTTPNAAMRKTSGCFAGLTTIEPTFEFRLAAHERYGTAFKARHCSDKAPPGISAG